VARDLHGERQAAPVSALFDLGSSGAGADIATHKDVYVGEALVLEERRRDQP
jgi:hypothetical protein